MDNPQAASTPAPSSPASSPKRPAPYRHAHLWLRPQPSTFFKLPGFLRRWGLQQPDVHRNPFLWPVRWVYRSSLLHTALEHARRAKNIVVIGDSSVWLSWEISQVNPHARLWCYTPQKKALSWAEEHFRERAPGRLDHVEFCHDLEQLHRQVEEVDCVIWSFAGGLVQEAERWAERLSSGGRFVYYEATVPSPLNLERWARWRNFWGRLGGQMSDAWNQRRSIENLYLDDAVRRNRQVEREAEQFQRLQVHLQIDHHRRVRPQIDTLLSHTAERRFWLWLPFLLLWDRALLASGVLDGSCRFATFLKK